MKEQFSWIKRILGTEGAKEENAEVLRRMIADGDDLTVLRDIDFHHLFLEEADSIAFKHTAREAGYPMVDHDFWPEMERWLTAVHVPMLPDLEKITRTELALNALAAPLNGEPDGWGCVEVEKAELS